MYISFLHATKRKGNEFVDTADPTESVNKSCLLMRTDTMLDTISNKKHLPVRYLMQLKLSVNSNTDHNCLNWFDWARSWYDGMLSVFEISNSWFFARFVSKEKVYIYLNMAVSHVRPQKWMGAPRCFFHQSLKLHHVDALQLFVRRYRIKFTS